MRNPVLRLTPATALHYTGTVEGFRDFLAALVYMYPPATPVARFTARPIVVRQASTHRQG